MNSIERQAVKVAHITTVNSSLRYLLLKQLQGIQQSGYEVVGISSPGIDTPAIEGAGIRHISIPMTRNLTPVADLVSLCRLCQVMRQERFTIIHTHTPKAGLLGQLAGRIVGVPIVINTLHGFYFHEYMTNLERRFYMTMEKIAAHCSSTILSQNREDVDTAVREGICRSEKIRHLGNGIDLTQFDPKRFSDSEVSQLREELGFPRTASVIGFVGRLAARRKGFSDFLAAAKRLSEGLPHARFLIIGEADHGKPDAVEPSAANDYGIADRCVFVGQRPNDELPLLYAAMDVFVLPSLFEGVPRAAMEAAAMQIPVVLSDVKGNREAVEPDRSGILIPLGDVNALAEAVMEILTDSEKARRMGYEGRRMALKCFDERLVFEKVKAEYFRLLLERGMPVPVGTMKEAYS